MEPFVAMAFIWRVEAREESSGSEKMELFAGEQKEGIPGGAEGMEGGELAG